MFRKRPIFLDRPARAHHRAGRAFLPKLFVLLVLLFAGGVASAQVSGSVSLVSDYIYRGVSLSNDNPEAQLTLNADFDSGWFAGLFASPIDLPSSHGLAIAYGGYARQLTSELSWEAGVSDTAYAEAAGQDYAEIFAGLSSDRFNGRLYYSPNYLGQSLHSIYGELNFNQPLNADWRLVAHAGYLSLPSQSGSGRGGSASHGDARVGVAYHAGDWNLQWALASERKTTVDAYYYPHVSRHYVGVFDAAWNF